MPCEEPTEWCSPAFFVPKGDGKRVRLVTDYTKLNRFVARPVHPFPLVSDIIQSIPASAACFAKLDAMHGYFQISVDEEASRLTTFILPSGRYHYGLVVFLGRVVSTLGPCGGRFPMVPQNRRRHFNMGNYTLRAGTPHFESGAT